MGNKLQVDMIVKAISEGFDKVTADMSKIGGAGDKSKAGIENFSKSMTELNSTISVVKQGVQTFTGVFEQAFEMGNQGAAVIQTKESFDLLLNTIGAAPDLLNQLKDASKDTVNEMTLMSSTATLLAGTSGEMGKSMANAAPQILEIAKAANKLNPTLGSTDFLYSSLMTGIKRGSPMLIDNTGLTIKLGEASDKYAKSLGKTAEQLSGTEQKQALLNAVLEAGGTMLEQVGGNTDSATDGFARLEVAIEKNKNKIKSDLAPALLNAADALYLILTRHDQLTNALDEHNKSILMSSKNYDDYVKEMLRAAEVAGKIDNIESNTALMWLKNGHSLGYVADKAGIYTRELYSLNKAEGYVSDGFNAELIPALEDTVDNTEAAQKALEDLNKKLADNQARVVDFGISGGLSKAWDDYKDNITDLQKEHADLLGDLKTLQDQGWSPTSEKVRDLNDALATNEQKQRDAQDAIKDTTRDLLFSQVSAGLDTQAKLALAEAMGILDTESYNAGVALDTLTRDYMADPNGDVTAYAGKVNDVAAAIERLKSKEITVTVTTIQQEVHARSWYLSDDVYRNQYDPTIGAGYASGADFVVPAGFQNDSYPLRAQSGEHVQITPAGQSSKTDVLLGQILDALSSNSGPSSRDIGDSIARALVSVGVVS